jgi:hypothetical protein
MSLSTATFETLMTDLEAFQKSHQEWLEKTWHQMNDFNMKGYMEGVIQNSSTATHLLETGTEDQLAHLYEQLKERTPYVGIHFMKGLLDTCYTMERLQQPFSKDVVRWFRKMGWKFPDFEFEKIESVSVQSIANE